MILPATDNDWIKLFRIAIWSLSAISVRNKPLRISRTCVDGFYTMDGNIKLREDKMCMLI